MGKANILGIEIDNVSLEESVEIVLGWLKSGGKRYIVTPNPEFLMAAQTDAEFKNILNNADLAIPDGSRLGWANRMISEKNFLKKILIFPFFLFPIKVVTQFDVVAGVDLMESLCREAAEKGFTTGFLGGQNGVAEKTVDCLQKKYKNLKVVLASDGPRVDGDGNIVRGPVGSQPHSTSSLRNNFAAGAQWGTPLAATPYALNIPKCDLLFVAFGQVKQEKWIAKNLNKIPVKVAMGVGGAFDYLSGNVLRAPDWIRAIGLEWLFRLILQPWRIKRQFQLINFLGLVLKGN